MVLSKKSKNLSEVKSFSSFSFNDVALDKSLDDLPSELVNNSYRYSDPCILERKEESEQKNENKSVRDFRSSESSILEATRTVSDLHSASTYHARSIDSWMEEKCKEEEKRQKIKPERENMKCSNLKKELSIMEKKPGKLIGNMSIHLFPFLSLNLQEERNRSA